MNNEALKERVKQYWNQESCGTNITNKKKFSHDYFEEIEINRYMSEPDIFAFAQFTLFHGKKVLEIGVGAGTDFLQWIRAGAQAYGIDLTPEAIENTKSRLELYQLKAADLRVADAENLPYPDNFFDLVYSWGVIHHSPNTQRCLEEIIRVTRPGGSVKIMVYNRHSLYAAYLYFRFAIMRGRPFQSLNTIIYNHQESMGTKAYTTEEIKTLLKKYPISLVLLQTSMYEHDMMFYRPSIKRFVSFFSRIFGWWHLGWYMKIEFRRD
jgi:ubiquinone/menaquinone biosynthesis C-methylase UbiE